MPEPATSRTQSGASCSPRLASNRGLVPCGHSRGSTKMHATRCVCPVHTRGTPLSMRSSALSPCGSGALGAGAKPGCALWKRSCGLASFITKSLPSRKSARFCLIGVKDARMRGCLYSRPFCHRRSVTRWVCPHGIRRLWSQGWRSVSRWTSALLVPSGAPSAPQRRKNNSPTLAAKKPHTVKNTRSVDVAERLVRYLSNP